MTYSIITDLIVAGDLLRKGRAQDDAGFVRMLFQRVLGRSPEPVESDRQIERLKSGSQCRVEMLIKLLRSQEFKSKEAEVRLDAAVLLEAGSRFIETVYYYLLERYPSDKERADWEKRMSAGQLTRMGVILAISQAPEAAEKGYRLEGLPSPSEVEPKVHIVLADRSWVIERLARELDKRLPWVSVGAEVSVDAPVQYFMPYTCHRPAPGKITAAFFTHIEDTEAARQRFLNVAGEVDVSVTMSGLYTKALEEAAKRLVQIEPGVDFDEYPLRKLRIGVVGRTYPSGRKGERIVQQLMDIPDIEWRFTGAGWPGPAENVPQEEMAAFYGAMDYILVPSLYEGGPMCVPEALACGTPVIAPPVGFVPDFPHIEYETGNVARLRRILTDLVQERRSRRRAVLTHSWERWALGHENLFKTLLRTKSEDKAPARPVGAIRALLTLHGPEGVSRKGGPSKRVLATAQALAKLGVQAEVSYGAQQDPSSFDLVHVFNAWDPKTALEQIEHLRRYPQPIVFSPIYLDLGEMPHYLSIPGIVARSRSYTAATEELGRLSHPSGARHTSTPEILDEAVPGYTDELRRMVASVDHVIFLSQHEREALTAVGVPVERFTFVPNGADADLFGGGDPAAFRDTFGLNRYALCVGALEERKNQLLLSMAMRDMDMPLVLIGAGHDQPYAEYVRRFGNPWTVFTGRIDDPELLRSAYAGAAVFALPSWAEGAPLAALEAAGAGAPLVLSNRSGEEEYFVDLATYCDPANVASIRAAIDRALTWDRTDYSPRVQGLLRSRYTWEHAAEATKRAYITALHQRVR